MRPAERVVQIVPAAPPYEERFTDLANSERFIAQHGDNVRYCYPWGRWIVYNGVRWERDETGQVHRLAKETVRSIYQEAAEAEDESRRRQLAKHASHSEAEARVKAMLELAKSEVPVSPDELDADPWKLNCLNGTIDLHRTGELQKHRREDLITKMAPVEYDPEARSEVWERCLKTITAGDGALERFLQRSAGYSLTGDVSEEVLFFVHGPAAAGKSTYIEALKSALGDYAT